MLLFVVACSDKSLARLEQITGINIHSDIKLAAEFDEWTELNGNGFKIRIYELEDNYGWIQYQDCSNSGLRIGIYDNINLKVGQIETFIEVSEPLCYRLLSSEQENELVILQGKKIVYYFSTF